MAGIYTRRGYDGTTSLWYGGRIPKHHPRAECYGAIDETASALGVARSIKRACRALGAALGEAAK